MSKRRYECKGYVIHHYEGPDEYDCEYPYAAEISCDCCIFNGGTMSPQTGKTFRGNFDLYPVPDGFLEWMEGEAACGCFEDENQGNP